MSKDSFLKGAAILGAAGIITKVLSALYRIPLSNFIGTEGLGYYQMAYPLYTLLIAVSTAGFPIAISKLISDKRALSDYRGAQRVFKIAFFGLLISGVVTSVFLGLLAKPIVNSIGNENGYYALIALVPALFFVPITSAFRGYFQGQQNMIPTAVSQIVEQVFRVGVGLPLAYSLLSSGLPKSAGGASFGESAGAIAAMIVVMAMYIKSSKSRTLEIETSEVFKEESVKTIAKMVLKIAVPITIGSAMVSIMNNIDTFLIIRRLKDIGYDEKVASSLFGQLTGNAQTIINFPQVISMSLAMSLVPAISQAMVQRRDDDVKATIKTGTRVTLLVGLPSAIGIMMLSTPIMKLLYFNNTLKEQLSAGALLQVLSISLIFITLVQTLTAILQGLGKPAIPVRNLLIAVVIKAVTTYVFTGIPFLNIKGAAISTVLTFLVAALLDFWAVKKLSGADFDGFNTFAKPAICSAIMGITVYLSYTFSSGTIGEKLATVVSIAIGGVVYIVSLFITKTLTREDLALFPKGENLADRLGL